ncbi:MAG: amino acid ABC transporter permease [Clostridia bacterium]|nr:amino acid ABC transporter permease [Clostridia bacterium]
MTKKESAILSIVSVLFPFVGLYLMLRWKKTQPVKAAKCQDMLMYGITLYVIILLAVYFAYKCITDSKYATIFSADKWLIVFENKSLFLNGLLTTVETAGGALLISICIGILFGLFATSAVKPLRAIARVYVEFFQNTPLILQLCFLYYALVFAGVNISIITTGIISLGLYSGAYMSEVLRAGIQSIPKGQTEAAHSQGFTYVQTMGYVILPQTVKVILPPAAVQIVALFKNTSCLLIIGGADLIATASNFVSSAQYGGAYGPAYIICGVLFFVVCFPISKLATWYENKLKNRDVASAKALHNTEAAVKEAA